MKSAGGKQEGENAPSLKETGRLDCGVALTLEQFGFLVAMADI